MSEVKERKMTIARALTRLKTLNAQLNNVISDIQAYGAGNNKAICRLSNKKTVADNHAEVEKEMRAKYQQFMDLTRENVKIKLAIEAANFKTIITVAGKDMTISEALVLQNHIMSDYGRMCTAFNYAVAQAQHAVTNYNNQFARIDDATAKASLVADVAYFVRAEDVKAVNEFITVFKAEINGVLNEVNAVTEIDLD